MNYLEVLIARIQDHDKWPDFDRPDFLEELDSIAERAYESKSVHGYLAALLIYHQLTEEMLRLLLEYCEFFVQLELAPVEIHFPIPERAMFGRLLDAAKSTMEFENKPELVALAHSINRGRIELVHGLTKQANVEDIALKVEILRKHFENFHVKFMETQDWFLLCFKDLRKDKEWDELLSDE